MPTCWAGIFFRFFLLLVVPFYLSFNVGFALSKQDTVCAQACVVGGILSMGMLVGWTLLTVSLTC